MNPNLSAKTVLCFGDSNTYGTKPDRSGRYGADERWTGLLQQQLGEDHYIIEEGLGGRTTDLDHYDPQKPSRNGFDYFKACIDSHTPLDVIIIMLGTNDLKTVYDRSAEDVVQALQQYPEYVRAFYESKKIPQPKVLIVSPPYMNAHATKFIESMPTPGIYDEKSAQKTKEFAEPMKRMAEETDCAFFDAGPITETGDDGCHITLESHRKLADAFGRIIKVEL